ncbi:PulJ/GspJ family protein [Calditerricola satsumensis]|uniref:Prepilin-type N-terminal cleavage/methylation domain-containing protein n=1 Tax=Calditerricola satsumensis TaxID=373054 RepID=A0A8J3BB76_9BACI|nr:prepilin-type N-terminal cleavage/methylation domain-containing protein [Calditerricola satsumensis]GGK01172.1 hypothetical protein GCM10007043_14030 [Calditerricola satsumensis]
MIPARPLPPRGVTLVELLAALGLLSVVVSLLYTIYHQIQDLGQTASATEDLLAEARLIQTEIVNAMRARQVDKSQGTPENGGNGTPAHEFTLFYQGGGSVAFTWDKQARTLAVDRNGDGFVLSERVAGFSYTPILDNDTAGNSAEVEGYTFTLRLDGDGDGQGEENNKRDLVTIFSVYFPRW